PVKPRDRPPPPPPEAGPGTPAERVDAGGIEEDERVVTDPAARTAGVVEPGIEAEIRRDPVDRVVHLAILVGAQVEHVHPCRWPMDHGVEYCIHAVPHVKVRLALATVPEHAQPRRIRTQLLIEVKHVTMGIALAED